MTRYLIGILLVVSFSGPALAANRQYDRASPDDCRILNVAPSYVQTTVRKGKRVFITRPTANVDMAIICTPEAAWR